MSDEIVRKGFLKKVGHSSTFFWHSRWFVLYAGSKKSPPRLTYAKKENDEEILGEIDLCEYNAVRPEEGKKLCFRIFHSENESTRPYVMNAETEEEFSSWISSIRSVFSSDSYAKLFKFYQERRLKVGQPPPEDTSTLIVQGWMRKLGGAKGGSKNWKKRWFKNFAQAPLVLGYYTSNNAKKSNQKGDVDLTQLKSISFSNESDGSLHVTAVTPQRVWEFNVDTSDRAYWKTSFTLLYEEAKRALNTNSKEEQQPKKKHKKTTHTYGDWQECYDQKGRLYYWNTETNLTQWNMPEEVSNAKEQRKARKRREKMVEEQEEQEEQKQKAKPTLSNSNSRDELRHSHKKSKERKRSSALDVEPKDSPQTSRTSSLKKESVTENIEITPIPEVSVEVISNTGNSEDDETPPPPQYDADNLPPGWRKAFDTKRNRVYYYNKDKQLTQWTVPTE